MDTLFITLKIKKLNFLKDDIFKESKKILKGKIKKNFSMNFII